MQHTTTPATVLVAKPELERHLRRMIDRSSVHRVAAELGVARESLLRYLAHVPLQTGTFRLVETMLAEAAGGRG